MLTPYSSMKSTQSYWTGEKPLDRRLQPTSRPHDVSERKLMINRLQIFDLVFFSFFFLFFSSNFQIRTPWRNDKNLIEPVPQEREIRQFKPCISKLQLSSVTFAKIQLHMRPAVQSRPSESKRPWIED